MITVRVQLYATLRRYRPDLKVGEPLAVQLAEGSTVAHLLQQLGVPQDEVKVVFVNGIVRDQNHPLADGDELGIFPPIGGG